MTLASAAERIRFELGLGIIKELDYRLVTVEYPAVEEERTYAINNAPSRVTFDVGDTIRTGDELELTVAEVNELNGLKVYMAHPAGETDNVQPVPETLLGHTLKLFGPGQTTFQPAGL